MRILVVNDDGIGSAGIAELASALSAEHEIVVCAPESERSAISHGITLRTPLRMHSYAFPGGIEAYCVNGTPADCVKLALSEHGRFDAVFAGINHGGNLGWDVLYSGTVSAAAEAAILKIPAVAVSCYSYSPKYFGASRKYAAIIAKYVERYGVPDYGILNLNVPNLPEEEVKGLKAAKLSMQEYSGKYEKRVDTRGREYYWPPGELYASCETEPETDLCLLMEGYATITPLKFDFTDRKNMEPMSKQIEELITSEGL